LKLSLSTKQACVEVGLAVGACRDILRLPLP
jgi:hypothetical protein